MPSATKFAKLTHENYRSARQRRSVETERKFTSAAEQLFAQRGYARTHVAEIIKLSGCSTGSFYHRFVDKEGLFRVMADNFLVDAQARIEGLAFDREIHGNLRTMVTYLAHEIFQAINANLGLYRAAHELSHDAPEVWQHLSDLTRSIGHRLVSVSAQYANEIKVSKPDQALLHAMQLIVMVVLQTRLGAGPLFPKGDAALITVLTHAALGVLGHA